MPQPISSLRHIKMMFFPRACDNPRQAHLQVVLDVLSQADRAEERFGELVINMVPKNPMAVAEHLNSLNHSSKKSDTFETFLIALLPDTEANLMRDAFRFHRQALKLRHPFAHSNFGYSPHDDDILLLRSSKSELIKRAQDLSSIIEYQKQGNELKFTEYREMRRKLSRASTMGYRLNELRSIKESIQLSCRRMFLLTKVVRKYISPYEGYSQLEVDEALRKAGLSYGDGPGET